MRPSLSISYPLLFKLGKHLIHISLLLGSNSALFAVLDIKHYSIYQAQLVFLAARLVKNFQSVYDLLSSLRKARILCFSTASRSIPNLFTCLCSSFSFRNRCVNDCLLSFQPCFLK